MNKNSFHENDIMFGNVSVNMEFGGNINIGLPCLGEPKGSDGDPKCKFFTLNTYQITFISGSLLYDCKNWKCDGKYGQTEVNVEIVM